jgi:hypothetical protein
MLASIGISCMSVKCVDAIAMRLVYSQYDKFFRDVDHRPKPDVEFNSQGIRDKREPSDFKADDYNVVFLGDSFVYGMRLWPYSTIPSLFEQKARSLQAGQRLNGVNFGWVSSSPYLSLRLLQRVGREYHPDLVVLCVDMTDFHDDIKYRKYVERSGLFAMMDFAPGLFLLLKDAAQRTGAHEALFGYPAERFFAVNHPLSETRGYFRYIQESIDAIKSFTVNDLGAHFVLIVFPRHYQYSSTESPKDWERLLYTRKGQYVLEPFKYFEELKTKVDYPVHTLLRQFEQSKVFPTTFYEDPHWNPAGAQLATDAILQILMREGLVTSVDEGDVATIGMPVSQTLGD